jgi:hypothetical protein
MVGLTWGFVVFMIILYMLDAGHMEDPLKGISLVLKGFVFLLFGVAFLMGNNINQEDLQIREELLKVKYQIVDLNEHFEKGSVHWSTRESSESKGTYINQEVPAMYDKHLSPIRKWGAIALIPIMLAQTGFFVYALFAEWGLPLLAKAGFGLGIVFSLTFAVILARIVIKGSYNLKKDPNIITGVTWVFLVFMITIVMMLAGTLNDPVKGISMTLNTLVFLVFGVVFLLQNTIHQANLRTREKLREIESQLTELNKRLAR